MVSTKTDGNQVYICAAGLELRLTVARFDDGTANAVVTFTKLDDRPIDHGPHVFDSIEAA